MARNVKKCARCPYAHGCIFSPCLYPPLTWVSNSSSAEPPDWIKERNLEHKERDDG